MVGSTAIGNTIIWPMAVLSRTNQCKLWKRDPPAQLDFLLLVTLLSFIRAITDTGTQLIQLHDVCFGTTSHSVPHFLQVLACSSSLKAFTASLICVPKLVQWKLFSCT